MATKKDKAPEEKTVRLRDPNTGSVVHVSEEYGERLSGRGYVSADASADDEDSAQDDERPVL